MIILAAGKGSKMFPYNTIRSKTTLKIAGKPLVRYNVESVIELGCTEIIVVACDEHLRGIKESLSGISNMEFVCVDRNLGTADSLEKGIQKLSNTENFLMLYGDTIIANADLELLYNSETASVLLHRLGETSRNWIGASIEKGFVSSIGAHYRGDNITHQFAGFCFDLEMLQYARNAPDYFPDVKVGVGTPRERYVEAGLVKALSHVSIRAIECKDHFFDIDKPWQMLEANNFMVEYLCSSIDKNIIAEGAIISDQSKIKGFVKLGKNSYIGDRVVIEGNLIVGDNTIIDNGAIFTGCAIIGDNTKIRNYCIIYDGASIGSNCIMDHCSEFLGGIIIIY